MTTAIGMVHAGLGIAILPESAVTPGTAAHVRMLPIRDPDMTREIGLLRRRERSLSPAAERLIDVMRDLIPGRG
jgi:DNA-binding transcriptional LysR family regulator